MYRSADRVLRVWFSSLRLRCNGVVVERNQAKSPKDGRTGVARSLHGRVTSCAGQALTDQAWKAYPKGHLGSRTAAAEQYVFPFAALTVSNETDPGAPYTSSTFTPFQPLSECSVSLRTRKEMCEAKGEGELFV